MRVMHVVADVGTYGAERLVVHLLERLRGQDLELAVLTQAPARPGDVPAGVEHLSAGRSGQLDIGFVARMVGAMRRWRPDIVHTHMHTGKYYGRLAAVLAGVGAVAHTEHNSEFGSLPVFRPLDRLLLLRTGAVVTFSAVQRERLVREDHVPAGKIRVIPNGIALAPPDPQARARARAELGAAEGEPLLLHVGRLSAVKNQALAIDALAALPDNVRLVFAGDGADRASLEQRARDRGVAERTAFLGYRADASALVAGADVALVTSRNEAMPLAVVEAMVAGTPLVSTPWAGAAEMLGGGAYGIVAADFSPQALAAAVGAALGDPAAARERALRAEAFARAEYDVATMARRHLELYRAMIAPMRSASSAITLPRS